MQDRGSTGGLRSGGTDQGGGYQQGLANGSVVMEQLASAARRSTPADVRAASQAALDSAYNLQGSTSIRLLVQIKEDGKTRSFARAAPTAASCSVGGSASPSLCLPRAVAPRQVLDFVGSTAALEREPGRQPPARSSPTAPSCTLAVLQPPGAGRFPMLRV